MLLSFKNYENPVLVVIQLLKQLRVKITDESVNDAILSHPDYPSLLAISDCLKQFGIENISVRTDKNQLQELPVPFIACMNNVFKTVTAVAANEVWCLNDDNKARKEVNEKFFENWSGVVLLSEAGESITDTDFEEKKRRESLQALMIPALIALGIC